MIETHPWEPKSDDGFADLPSHDTWISGVPYSTFKRMRDEEPVCWTPEKDDSGFWSITRYQDVIEANHQKMASDLKKWTQMKLKQDGR